ncbi:MAG TPA: penicillin-binding protein 2 [bacterium]|nr:penicillin-binding protein 2 [bacterium]
MTNPFATPEDLLKTKRNYQISETVYAGDDFFIDKKYQGSIARLLNIKKVRLAFLVIILFFIILWSRVFYLQIKQGDYYHNIAEGNRIKSEVVAAPRGIFYDRYGLALTENDPSFSFIIERENLKKMSPESQEKLQQKIVFLTGLSQTEVAKDMQDFLSETNKKLVLDFEASYDKTLYFLAHQADFLNLESHVDSQRKYLAGENLSHVLGYLARINADDWSELKKQNYQYTDLIGQIGLEYQYETILHGQPGYINHEVDASGRELTILKKNESRAGADLILTIDARLNKKLAEELTLMLKKNNLKKAAAVALDPKSGAILAFVSLPSFDNNFFSNVTKHNQEIKNYLTDQNKPLFNRVITGEFPSGSTIKPVFALAALEEGLITKSTSFLSSGGLRIDKWFFPDWKDGGHGLTNVIKALAESVNTFFYYIGGGYENFQGLGLEKMMTYANKFGFGNLTNLDLPAEKKGFLPTKDWKVTTKNENWYIGDTYHIAIGQGDILVTPLQIANMTAAIANGGILYQPFLVQEIIESSGAKTVTAKKVLNENFARAENIAIVREGMRQAVVVGSARSLSDLSFTSAGKTGTAQVGGEAKPHAWFTVFAPYENSEIALTILIENGNEGSTVALPVAKEVLKWYFEKSY